MKEISWDVAQARIFSKMSKKYGIRSRVVRCKNTQSYTAIYRDNLDDFSVRYKSLMDWAKAEGWDGRHLVFDR